MLSFVHRKRDEELSIRQQELQLEHRHAQLKEELNLRLSFNSKYRGYICVHMCIEKLYIAFIINNVFIFYYKDNGNFINVVV